MLCFPFYAEIGNRLRFRSLIKTKRAFFGFVCGTFMLFSLFPALRKSAAALYAGFLPKTNLNFADSTHFKDEAFVPWQSG
jgi:hypothetical protein